MHHPAAAGSFNYRPHRRFPVKLPAYTLFVDTGCYSRHIGHQRLLRGKTPSPNIAGYPKEQVLTG